MMVKNLQRDGIFPGDDQVQNLPGTGSRFGDILSLQFLHVGFPRAFSHGQEYIADKKRPAAATARGPEQLSLPARVEEIFIALWNLIRLDHFRVVAKGVKI